MLRLLVKRKLSIWIDSILAQPLHWPDSLALWHDDPHTRRGLSHRDKTGCPAWPFPQGKDWLYSLTPLNTCFPQEQAWLSCLARFFPQGKGCVDIVLDQVLPLSMLANFMCHDVCGVRNILAPMQYSKLSYVHNDQISASPLRLHVKLPLRQIEPLPPMKTPIQERNNNDPDADRTGVIHSLFSNGQSRRES